MVVDSGCVNMLQVYSVVEARGGDAMVNASWASLVSNNVLLACTLGLLSLLL